MVTAASKSDTLKVRVDSTTLDLLERARIYAELDKSKFIRQSIREKAEIIIAEHETTFFSEKDWRMFFDIIDNPPEPTKRIKRAAKKHREIIG